MNKNTSLMKIELQIKERLLARRDLTKKQVEFITRTNLPRYKSDCSQCRIALLMQLGLSYAQAYKRS